MNLGFLEGCGQGEFYPAEKRGEPSIGDQRPPAHRATFSPGGERNSRPRPRLRPGRGGGVARVRASRPWALLGRGKSAGSGAPARAREVGHGPHFAGSCALLLDRAEMAKQIVQSQFFIFQKTI